MRLIDSLGVARRGWRSAACWFALALSILLVPGDLLAQGWQGTARIAGVVRGSDGQPLAGATVVLRWARDPEQGPPATVTDGKGRWAYLGLAPGQFLLTVRADGHRESHGTVEVRSGPAPRVEVTLESLAVEPPRFSERRTEDLLAWIETGNSLLAAGEWAAARAEYEKALGELEGESRAEVLSAVARTHYMEGDVDRSLERLEEAIVLAPDRESGRAIYRSIMEAEGRSDEAERFLARVDAGELEAVGSEDGAQGTATAGGQPTAPVPVEIEPGRTGRFRTGFRQRHPDSALEVLAERFARPTDEALRAEAAGERYDIASERFAVFVPEGYEPHPANPEKGWGLVVWVSPTDEGDVPGRITEAVLAERRLLWVGADDSGNQRQTWQRVALALDG
ncbi:MAG: carboxypeptidase-like regulatory domain-containing protein, partial [Thermoanaerobaculia bacterium]|nr:carboxypeptidase-like regulatory domain-containing protein [Thermoanaerobaculia bacterium]